MKQENKFMLLLMVCLLQLMAAQANPVKFSVTGRGLYNLNGFTVRLAAFSPVTQPDIDSAVVKNGEFLMEGATETARAGYIYSPDAQTNFFCQLVIGDEGTVVIQMDNGIVTASGGKQTPYFQMMRQALMAATTITDAERQELIRQLHDSKTPPGQKKAIEERQAAEENHLLQAKKDFILSHADNSVSAFYFAQTYKTFSPEELAQLRKTMTTGFSNDPLAKRIFNVMDAAQNRQVGRRYVDFQLPDTLGCVHHLSEYVSKGRYVLLDFWAYWNKAWKEQLPELMACYRKYHDAGFDVVGVNVEDSHDNWLAAIHYCRLPWHQLSDLKGWFGPVPALYGVDGLPCNVLIGPDGKIIASDLSMEELGRKMAELTNATGSCASHAREQ